MSCIIVMGCFRSGTSAVAGTLHHLGVFMGERFDKPNSNNPKGFWEDLDFKEIHSAYEENGQDLVLFHRGLDVNYRGLISKREADHQLWGVKDPLLCKHLKKLTSNISDYKLIVCRRSVEDIAASMGRAIGFPSDTFLPLAKSYVDELDMSLAEYTGPRLEIQKTDSMLQILEPICEFVGLPSNQAAIDFLS